MLKKILMVIAAVIFIFVVIVMMQPSDFRISRSAVIAAPPQDVFAQVNNFHNWEAWSPWAKLDPQAKAIYEGPSAGEGAIFKWSGNNEVGEGSNTIMESRPDELITIKLEFLKPFQATNTAEFTFKPEGNATVVTWSMYGKNNFVGKAMGLIMNCDKMLGGQFEQGLAQLKSVVENQK
jgi:hypothetical protein